MEYTCLYESVSVFQRQPIPHSIIWGNELIDTPLALTTMFYYILSKCQSFENSPVVATTFVLVDQCVRKIVHIEIIVKPTLLPYF